MNVDRPILVLPADPHTIPDAVLHAFLEAALAHRRAPPTLEAAEAALEAAEAIPCDEPMSSTTITLRAIVASRRWMRLHEATGREAGETVCRDALGTARWQLERELQFQELHCERREFGPPGENRGWLPTADHDGFELLYRDTSEEIVVVPRGTDPAFVAAIVAGIDVAYARGLRDGAGAGADLVDRLPIAI